jgi:hypothetical protein
LPNTVSVVPLKWKETAPGLLYEARRAGERLFVIAFDGEHWTLDLFQDTEYAREQLADPQPAPTLDAAKRMAHEWEAELH